MTPSNRNAYYVDWTGIDDFSDYVFDAKGLPIVDYGAEIGLQYNPVTISQFGLFQYNQFLQTNQSAYRTRALAAASWLVQKAVSLQNGSAGWYYNFDLNFYPVRSPWLSAMAQGEAISLLIRSYAIENDRSFVTTAQRASLSFQSHINDGGICATFSNGTLSLEEFPSHPPSHVLNGSIFALFGLFDSVQYFDDPVTKEIYGNAITGLKSNLSAYDTGYWSRYDLFPIYRLASRAYHALHIRLLFSLFSLTGDTFFKDYAEKWNSYFCSKRKITKWGINKIKEKIRLKWIGK